MKGELLLAVTQLAAERNLPRGVVMSAIEAALVSAYKRDTVTRGHDVAVQVRQDGSILVRTFRTVVDEVEEPGIQISVEEARKAKPDAAPGDIIYTGEIEGNPGRIAAQTAKQVVMQRLREAERDLVFDEYADKAGEVISAVIQRVEPRQVIVDLGRAEALLPPSEQVPFERYRPGQQLKFYVLAVNRTVRGPEIVLSRTHTELLRRLFETEVPEIFNGIIEIKAIAREPGSRSKVAVHSNQPGVDAVGASVGLRGLRIQNIVGELLGEKIDVIEWDEDPAKFLANSLSPAAVEQVRLDQANQSATVIVPDRQLSLAIGREGQNARLAAKLTNWHIDIRGAEEAAAAGPAPEVAPAAAAEAEATPVAEQPVEEVPLSAAAQEAAEAAPAEAQPVEVARPQEAKPEPVRAAAEVPAAPDAPAADELQPVKAAEESDKDTEMALLALEEELAELERQEAARRAAEEAAPTVEVSSDDVWQVTRSDSDSAGMLRFAEDIAGYREYGEGRRGGRGRRSDKLSPKARKAAAKKGAGSARR